MSVYKRNKFYWYKFTWRGRRISRTTRQNNRRTAEELEAAHRTRLARGEAGLHTDQKQLTFAEFATEFEKFVAVRSKEKPNTIRFYRGTVARLLDNKVLAKTPLGEITEAMIETHIQKRRESVAIGTMNRELATLRRMLRLAATKWKLIAAPPNISLLSGDGAREFVLNRKIETAYLDACDAPLGSAARIMLDTGMRVGELTQLRWDDVFIEPASGAARGFVVIRKGKSKNAKRNLSMTDRVRDTFAILSALRTHVGSEFVFPGRELGKAVSITWMEKLHQRARVEVGLGSEFVLHSLRHTFATRLGESGAEAFTIMKAMGHSSVAVSQHYVHPTPESMERAFDRLQTENEKPAR